ncbi:MAG TPA: restriction endonuclease subunit S [Pyrinomonadaceae bacterium]|nr:restriction endonuclease subunit S [Pyrinomonadaceae bacterium]
MELKPGYKQTEVGVIPEEWSSPALETLGAGAVPPIKAGPFGSSLTKDQYVPVGYKVYGQEQVIRGDYLYGDYFISPRKYRELDSCAVRPGDVLLSLVGTIGKLLELPDDAPPGVINPRLIRFSFDRERVLPRFFTYLFESASVQVRLERQAQGGTMGVLNAGILRPFRIPLPPLPEQRAIAEALSAVDGLLDGLDRLIAKKRDLKQAAMQQLLIGQTRLPGFHGEWAVKQLGEIGEIAGAGVDKKTRPGEIPVRLLNYMDVYKKDFISSADLWHEVSARPEQARRCAVQFGDIFFTPTSEVRDDIGHSAVAMEDIPDTVYSYHVVRLRLTESWDIRYRAYAFKTKGFMDQASTMCEGSGTRYVITLPKFRALTVRFPKDVAEQTAIAEVLSDMDAEIAALERRREKTRALKQAMMQELLTGKTRLVAAAGVSYA